MGDIAHIMPAAHLAGLQHAKADLIKADVVAHRAAEQDIGSAVTIEVARPHLVIKRDAAGRVRDEFVGLPDVVWDIAAEAAGHQDHGGVRAGEIVGRRHM
jgi:hypothetical protein